MTADLCKNVQMTELKAMEAQLKYWEAIHDIHDSHNLKF